MKKNDIKNKLKSLVYQEGMTLNELASKLKMSQSGLSNMLSRGKITFEKVELIAKELGYEIAFNKKNTL